ncbi:hypothetical protein BS50DRAFT_295356 [Corynespora cassiicola Philippines]|uniref:Fungal N-terminal domain-containing protein n=1 Tax=Corynespora cassiicola Philippines TaxID=1448308 RepID=A0A2T2NWD9_CORCC|nr:hypothetical protein BS50DRAFT_295356 [Corynespora cassiicola Philippines]
MEIGLALLGGVAAGWAISAEIVKICKVLRKVAKSIRYARREISRLEEEMAVFGELLDGFLRVCSKDDEHVFSSTGILLNWARDALEGIKNFLNNVKALQFSPGDQYSYMETLKAHWDWYFGKSAMKYYRALMRVARESINGFTNIRIIQLLKDTLNEIRNAVAPEERRRIEERHNMPIEEVISTQKRIIRRYRRKRHKINEELQNAKLVLRAQEQKYQDQTFILKSDQLLEFADSVGEYIEDVLSSRTSSSRTTTSGRSHELNEGLVRESAPRIPSSTAISPIRIASRASSRVESNDLGRQSPQTPEATSAFIAPSPSQGPKKRPAIVVYTLPKYESVDKFKAILESKSSDMSHGRDPSSNDVDVIPTDKNGEGSEIEAEDGEESSDSDAGAGPSIFQPVAGVQGKAPKRWRKRHQGTDPPRDV